MTRFIKRAKCVIRKFKLIFVTVQDVKSSKLVTVLPTFVAMIDFLNSNMTNLNVHFLLQILQSRVIIKILKVGNTFLVIILVMF